MEIKLGSHVEREKPLLGAMIRGASAIQINLSAPQTWRDPIARGDEGELKNSGIPIFVHAPYLLNPASINPEQRAKTKRALIAQLKASEVIGAAGLVVHGGHPTGGGSLQDGVNGWLEVLSGISSSVKTCIENTAGGSSAVARDLAGLKLLFATLRDSGFEVGFVLDTCHSHAGGIASAGLIESVINVVGKIDLVHLNDSKDLAGSGRDRHQNLGLGEVGDNFLLEVVRDCNTPVVVETPGGFEMQRDDILWVKGRL